jgi:hypothetical protein
LKRILRQFLQLEPLKDETQTPKILQPNGVCKPASARSVAGTVGRGPCRVVQRGQVAGQVRPENYRVTMLSRPRGRDEHESHFVVQLAERSTMRKPSGTSGDAGVEYPRCSNVRTTFAR